MPPPVQTMVLAGPPARFSKKNKVRRSLVLESGGLSRYYYRISQMRSRCFMFAFLAMRFRAPNERLIDHVEIR